MNEFKAARYQYGVDPVYGRTSFLPVDRDKEYFASEGLYVREEAYVALEAALAAATDASSCPGHGRSKCVSCCWPKGETPEPAGYTAVDMGTAAADGYRDGVDNVEPEWVVNSIVELGVKVGDRFYFLYKGRSLEYTQPEDEHEKPLMWRPVFKREFGEVCTPINRYAQGLIGTVSHEDSDEWRPLPARSVEP